MNEPELEKSGMSIKKHSEGQTRNLTVSLYGLCTFFGRSKLKDTVRRHVKCRYPSQPQPVLATFPHLSSDKTKTFCPVLQYKLKNIAMSIEKPMAGNKSEKLMRAQFSRFQINLIYILERLICIRQQYVPV
jgi:hypothetical protein